MIEKARKFQKNIFTSASLITLKPLTVWIMTNWKILQETENTRPPYLPPEKSVCRSRSNSENWTWNNGLVPNWESSMSRLHIVYLASMQSTSCEMPGWMKHKLESRLSRDISITSDTYMTPL